MSDEYDDQSFIADIENYIVKKQIGKGGFSSVYLAIHKLTQIQVAIKTVEKSKVPVDIFQRELRLMKMLDHPFCLSFFENFEDESFWYIVMEYVQSGTLLKEINKSGGLPEWKARHVFCQLIVALNYLHNELHLIHRDIKAENVMLDRNFNIRLIDFGLSNTCDCNELLKTACGSPAYAPPEMLTGKEYANSADIWSVGVVLFAMVCGHLPFQDAHVKRLVQRIVYMDPIYPHTISPELQDLLSRLLNKDATTRITIPEIFIHPWFQNYPDYEKLIRNFGIEQGWRSPRDEETNLDQRVISMLEQMEIPTDSIMQDLKNNTFSPAATAYKIMKKELITDDMNHFYDNASLGQKKRFPIAMQPAPLATYCPGSAPRKRLSLLAPSQAMSGPYAPTPLCTTLLSQARVNRRRTSSNADMLIKDVSLEKLRNEYQMQLSHIAEDPNKAVPALSTPPELPNDGHLPTLVKPTPLRRRRMSSVVPVRGTY